jgi:hypothetical protein
METKSRVPAGGIHYPAVWGRAAYYDRYVRSDVAFFDIDGCAYSRPSINERIIAVMRWTSAGPP